MHKIVPGVSAVAAVEVEPACGGGVALVRAAFTVGEGGAEEDGDASCGGGDRARLKDAMGQRCGGQWFEWGQAWFVDDGVEERSELAPTWVRHFNGPPGSHSATPARASAQ